MLIKAGLNQISKEGIDYVQQMALFSPSEISSKTKFSSNLVSDCRDQSILYVLTTYVVMRHNDS
jgi:hypothetical protein